MTILKTLRVTKVLKIGKFCVPTCSVLAARPSHKLQVVVIICTLLDSELLSIEVRKFIKQKVSLFSKLEIFYLLVSGNCNK